MKNYIMRPLSDNVDEMFIGPFGSSLKNDCFVKKDSGYCMVYEQKHAIQKTMDVETRYVTEEKYNELKRFNICGGDIIVSCRGTIGETFIVPDDAPLGIMHPSIMKIRLKKDVYDKSYFNLLLQKWLRKHETGANGSGVKMAISAKKLGAELFPVPPIEEQLKISDIILKVHQIINERTQQLQKLDELVKARFIELFGTETEFDKWPCCTIGDVADVCVGVVIKPTQYYTDKGIPAFRSLNIGEMHVKDSDWVYFTEEGHQKNQKSVVHKNDVLIVRSGAPGTACVATEKYDGYNAVDIIIAHPDNSKVNSIFLAAFTNMPHGMNQIRERTGGAAQQHFNVGDYKAMRLIMPSIELQNQYAAFVEQTDKSKVAVQKALDEAQLLFDSLMQKYFG